MSNQRIKITEIVKISALVITPYAIAGSLYAGYELLWRAPAHERIVSIRNGVIEITLTAEGFPDRDLPRPVFEPGYARWINFERVVFKNIEYTQVGSDASFIRKNTKPTRYVIKESLYSKRGLFNSLSYSKLEILDTQTGEILATKEWRCRTECDQSSDYSYGWHGQHAASFVRKVLNADMKIGGHIGIKPYPKTTATVKEIEPTTSMTRAQLTSKMFGCPDYISIYTRRDPLLETVLSGETWEFLPPRAIRQVYCLSDGIFIVSSVYSNDVFLDWISYHGNLIGQFHTKERLFPMSEPHPSQHAVSITSDGSHIQLRMVYLNKRPKEGEALKGQRESLIDIDIHASEKLHLK